jgi:hypothetical protein
MANLYELRKIAFNIRAILEEYGQKSKSNAVFNNFPRGACGGAVDIMGQYVIETFGLDTKYVTGYLPDGSSHAWIVVNGIIVDITADQFGEDPVIVTRKSDWHAKLRTESPCPIYPREKWPAENRGPWNAIVDGMRIRGFPVPN